jgi:hypothetical protein
VFASKRSTGLAGQVTWIGNTTLRIQGGSNTDTAASSGGSSSNMLIIIIAAAGGGALLIALVVIALLVRRKRGERHPLPAQAARSEVLFGNPTFAGMYPFPPGDDSHTYEAVNESNPDTYDTPARLPQGSLPAVDSYLIPKFLPNGAPAPTAAWGYKDTHPEPEFDTVPENMRRPQTVFERPDGNAIYELASNGGGGGGGDVSTDTPDGALTLDREGDEDA